jgi:hypothetical protein
VSMPMPKTVRVGPYTYTVSQDVATLQAHEREKSGAFSGYTDHSKLLIVIGPDEAPDAQRETMWHEVKHAVHHLFHNSRDEASSDEDHIRKMAPMELAVLRDNPTLVAYLLASDDDAYTLTVKNTSLNGARLGVFSSSVTSGIGTG